MYLFIHNNSNPDTKNAVFDDQVEKMLNNYQRFRSEMGKDLKIYDISKDISKTFDPFFATLKDKILKNKKNGK